jgi:acetyl esterase/lipase
MSENLTQTIYWIKASWPWATGLVLIPLLLFILYWVFFSNKPSVKHYIYKNTPQGKLDIQVHFPHDWTKNDHRPAVLFFFGGGWISGNINHFTWQSDYFAKRGMVTVRASYRIDSKHHTTPDKAVEDGQDALQWLHDHATQLGINPQHIVASGGSAGGHIAACLALCTSPTNSLHKAPHPNLLVLFNPVLDLTNASSDLEFSARELTLIQMIGNETAHALSPNQHITEQAPHTLLIFGDNDPLIQQGKSFAEKATNKSVYTKMLIAPNKRHGFFTQEPWRSATIIAVDNFLIEQGYLTGTPLISSKEVLNAPLKTP